MNHGQQAGQVALSGAGKEQAVRDRNAEEKKQLMHLICSHLQHIYTQVTQGHESVKMRLKEEGKVKSTKQMEIY